MPPSQDDPRQWVVRTVGYYYAFTADSLGEQEILAFHWHPEDRGGFPSPHLHVGPAWLGKDALFSPRWHVPTRHISIEDIIRFALTQFPIPARRGDWHNVLQGTNERFRAGQTSE